jgi:serine/threonine protein kinase
MINNKYIIINKIGSGSFGLIYKGQNVRTKEYVAIKVEPINDIIKMLKNETKIYQYLNDCQFVPQIKWFGKDDNNYYMVINLLGKSLQNIIDIRKKFSLTLTLKVGIKLLTIMKSIHDKGLVHRDIKPHNFLFSSNSLDKLYIIDFGFCKTYLVYGEHIKQNKINGLIGSANYASINSHKKMELSRRDDLESIFYMLFYFLHGSLPWSEILDESIIAGLKIDIIEHNYNLPTILLDFIKYIREIKFEETPNYFIFIDKFIKEIELISKIS